MRSGCDAREHADALHPQAAAVSESPTGEIIKVQIHPEARPSVFAYRPRLDIDNQVGSACHQSRGAPSE